MSSAVLPMITRAERRGEMTIGVVVVFKVMEEDGDGSGKSGGDGLVRSNVAGCALCIQWLLGGFPITVLVRPDSPCVEACQGAAGSGSMLFFVIVDALIEKRQYESGKNLCSAKSNSSRYSAVPEMTKTGRSPFPPQVAMFNPVLVII